MEIVIPGYKIIKEIGRGGMAKVYSAVQLNFDRPVALKVMAPHLVEDPIFGERFLREARIIASMNHRNIVPVYDVGSHGNYHYLAMELLPGGDFKTRLRGGVRGDFSLKVIHDIADALAYAHRKSYIHRDVKPENILFREDNTAALTDFGIAKALDNSDPNMTVAGMIVGSPHYMSPEQALAQDIDHRTDIYSLGVVLYESLVGKPLYNADSSVAAALKHISDPVPELPPPYEFLQDILEKLVAKKPENRFRDATEVVKALAPFINKSQEDWDKGFSSSDPSKASTDFTSHDSVTQIAPGQGNIIASAVAQAQQQSQGASKSAQRKPSRPQQSSFSESDYDDEFDPVMMELEDDYDGYDPDTEWVNLNDQNSNERRGMKDAGFKSAVAVFSGVMGIVLVAYFIIFKSPFADDVSHRLSWISNVQLDKDLSKQYPELERLSGDTKHLYRQALGFEIEGRLTESYQLYAKILDMDDGRFAGSEGIKRVASTYLENAKTAIHEKRDVELAQINLSQAMKVSPNRAGIEAVQRELNQLIAELKQLDGAEREAAEISILLAKAAKNYELGKYTEPDGDNARYFYQTVLSRDPGNKRAQLGLRKVSARVKEELKNVFNETLSSDTHYEIDELLKKGSDALDKGYLLLPKGSSAYEYYTAVLDLDPQDQHAVKGLENIIKRYLALASKEVNAENLIKSGEFVDSAMDIANRHDIRPGVRGSVLRLKDTLNRLMQIETADNIQKWNRVIKSKKALSAAELDQLYNAYLAAVQKDIKGDEMDIANRLYPDVFFSESVKKLKRNNLEASKIYIVRGLNINPNHDELRDLDAYWKRRKEGKESFTDRLRWEE